MQANIFKIKRNELADGSGLRTTIYFKGCPLRCVWCSTPQAHERPTRILWDSKHCLYCNLCVSECPTGSLAFSASTLNRSCPLPENKIKFFKISKNRSF